MDRWLENYDEEYDEEYEEALNEELAMCEDAEYEDAEYEEPHTVEMRPPILSEQARQYLKLYNPQVPTEEFEKLVHHAARYEDYDEYIANEISYQPWMDVFFEDSLFDDYDEGYDYEWQLVEAVLYDAWDEKKRLTI